MTSTEAAIHEYLTTEIFYDKDLADLGPGDSLIDRGLLDSLAILKMVTFCEEEFGVTIPDTDVVPDHFETVSAIAKLVERQKAGA